VAFSIKDDSRADARTVASICSATSLNEMPSVISPAIHDLALPLTTDANKENTSPFPSSSVSSLPPVPPQRFDNTSCKSSDGCEDYVKPPDVSHRLVASDCLCNSSMDDLVVDVTVSENDSSLALPVAASMEINHPSAIIGIHDTSSNHCATAITSRKRSFDEVEDCDVHDVLSQFYMPPTPRMLTSIDDTDDEDEDINVVDIDIVTPGLELAESSALQPSNAENVNSTNSASSARLSSLPVSLVNQEEPMSNSYKRPRFSDGTDDLELDVDGVKELEIGKNVDQKAPSFVPSSAVSEIPVTSDRLTRTTDIHSTDLPSARDLDDREDIEVVLEDSEDIQRRMLLRSATSSTSLTRTSMSSACWALSDDSNIRTSGQACGSPVVTLETEAEEETQQRHLRFSSNLSIDTKPGLPVGNTNGTYCGIANDNNNTAMANNASNNNSPMMLDTMEQHQYSCGHSSIFNDLQSVVFHSLIPSLES